MRITWLMAWGRRGKRTALGLWEIEYKCTCVQCATALYMHVSAATDRSSYLPAVRMLQRLRHTEAIVLPLWPDPLLHNTASVRGLSCPDRGTPGLSYSVRLQRSLCRTASASTTSFPRLCPRIICPPLFVTFGPLWQSLQWQSLCFSFCFSFSFL